MDLSWLLLELARGRQLHLRNELIRCLKEDETSRHGTIDGLVRVASVETKGYAIPALALLARPYLLDVAGELEKVFNCRFSAEVIDNLDKFPGKYHDEITILVALLGGLTAAPAELRARIAGQLASYTTFERLASRLARS